MAGMPALRVGRAEDVRDHCAQVADHRQAAVGRIAVVDVALAAERRAGRVGEVLAGVLAQVTAPDQVSAEPAVGPRDHVGGLVEKEGDGHAEALVTLAAGDRPLDQALAEELQEAIVGRP